MGRCSIVALAACLTSCTAITGAGDYRFGAMDAGAPDGAVDASAVDAGADAAARDAGDRSFVFPPRDFRCPDEASPPCRADVPLRTELERTRTLSGGPDASYTYLLGPFTLPGLFEERTEGLNLDGLISPRSSVGSGSCEESASDYPGDEHAGVDNVVGSALLPTLEALASSGQSVNEAALAQHVTARDLFALTVIGVGSLSQDNAVVVELSRVQLAALGTPAPHSEGAVVGGQAVLRETLLARSTSADIFDGRLRAVFDHTRESVRLRGAVPEADIYSALLEVHLQELRADLDEGELAEGVIGARVSVGAFAAAASEMLGTDATPILESLADLDGPSAPCGQISIALTVQGAIASETACQRDAECGLEVATCASTCIEGFCYGAACPSDSPHQRACDGEVCRVNGCGSYFGDCDGLVGNGCEADFVTDPDHCGGCDSPCGANADCESFICVCQEGYSDCTGAAGCETDVDTDVNNCGGCGAVCDLPMALEACVGGQCEIESCAGDTRDCDAVVGNGCETNVGTDVAHCGLCNRPCVLAGATPACVSGTCRVGSCNTGRADCDASAANGCETHINSNDNHCGACGNVCAPGTSCVAANCEPT